MARITGVVFGRENPKGISFADGPADAGHGGRLRLLYVLIQQRQVAIIKFRHIGMVADDIPGHHIQLAIEGLFPQRTDNE